MKYRNLIKILIVLFPLLIIFPGQSIIAQESGAEQGTGNLQINEDNGVGEKQNLSDSESEENNESDGEQNLSDSESEENNESDEEQNLGDSESEENNESDEEQNLSDSDSEENNESDEEQNLSDSDSEGNNESDEKQDSSDSQSNTRNSEKNEHQPKSEENISELSSNSYKDGDKGPHVVELKENLTILGFKFPENPTPFYGKVTEGKVKDFQRYYGLKETGIADQVTLKRIEKILSSQYRNGESGNHIVKLKKELTLLGFGNFPKNPSTVFGNVTEGVVKDFQSYYDLVENGIADEVTLSRMEEILSPPYQAGDRSEHIVRLKKDLTLLGFGNFPKNPSNIYGKVTTGVVKEFQKYYGLAVDGSAGPETIDQIEKILSSPYRNGERGDHIVKLKKDLTLLGFGSFPKNPSTVFGNVTEGVVKDFQSYYDLVENGIVDEVTLNRMEEILSPPYQAGDRGEHIIKLKRDLTLLGFGNFPKNPSNVYGKVTTGVVKDFQSYYGLTADGSVGPATMDQIDKVLSSTYQDGERGDHIVKLKKDLTLLGFGNFPKNPSTVFGSVTEAVVKDFQSYYGLAESGIADDVTLNRMEEILSPPYQAGDRSEHIRELKKDLTQLGFGNFPKNPSTVFGKVTAGVVKEFQEYYGLPINGVMDKKALDLLEKEIQSGKKTTTTNYDIKFNDALNIQMNNAPQTDKYSGKAAYVSAKYVDITNHSAINSTGNVNLRTSPSLKNNNVAKSAKNGDKITILGEVKGDSHQGSTKWYKINYKNDKTTLYVHSSLVSTSSTAKVTGNVNVRSGSNTSSHIYGQLTKGTTVTIVSKGDNWHQIKYKTWRNPTRNDVESYLNPNNNDEFQHLVLSSTVKVSASELNKVLKGKGVLEGLGQAFIDGGEKHSVNEVYLISHALLETGHGTSELAKGIEVGLNKDGNPVLATSSNKKNLTEVKKVYNMFGIGAADSDPKRLGAVRAYNEGWTTPKKAVEGGAKFIGERYIHNSYKQNTLYKMRWNPDAMESLGYADHQYATDIGWAVKQVSTIKNLYEKINGASLHFDIPKYK